MLQKPNTVFVGKKYNYAATSLAVGDVVLINAATGAVIAETGLTSSVDKIQLGYVAVAGSTPDIKKSGVISKSEIKNLKFSAYSAKSEAESEIDFTGATLVAGYRYVIRMVYKDLYEHPGQFTHSYEVFAETGETATTIADKFVVVINKHKGARITAAATDGVLTLTAKEAVKYGPSTDGKEAITKYFQVRMNAFLYYTVPASLFGNAQLGVPGVEITNTDSKPGKGNPYIVRDREQAALAYKGITFRTTWPIIKPELNVDLSKTYDTIVIEYANKYQSPDNQYVKSTELASEIYIDSTAASNAKATDLNDALVAWAA